MRTYLSIFLVFFNLILQVPAPLYGQSSLSTGNLADSPIASILPNGGFEYSKAKWSVTGGTFAIVNSGVNLGLGKAGATWDSNAAGQFFRSDLITIPNALQAKDGLLSCTIKTPSGTATHTLRATDGTNVLATKTISSTSSFLPTELNFIFPGSGSVRLEIASTAADEPLIAIDDCFIGKAYNIKQALNIPVGTVFPVAMASCPVGSLVANGSTISRTAYADLFSAISTVHGTGDGSTTFHLPDYRGRFLRGVAGGSSLDPDRASRTAMNTGGNTGDNVGSVQGQATAKNGLTASSSSPAHSHTGVTRIGNPTRYSTASLAAGTNAFAALGDSTSQTTDGTAVSVTTTINAGDNETRPVNAYVTYCIQHAPSVKVYSPEQVIDSTGTVITVAMSACPTNSLEANGALISRTTYAKLFTKMGTIHGVGDGSTTFNLPDYRGRFLRGQANGSSLDPDRAGRTAMNSGGATADNVGSVQGQAFQTHTHGVTDPGHNHSITGYSGGGAASTIQATTFSVVYNSQATSSNTTGISIQNTAASGATAQVSVNETRPVNAYVKYCVIYDGTIQAPQIIDLQKVAVVYETDLATSAVNGVPTKAALPSPSLDTVGGSGSNEYTIKVAGTYFASVSIATAAATGSKSFGIYKNGVAIHNGGGEAGIYQVMNGGVLLPNLIVGDVISIYFINSSGTTENWVINNFSMFKL